MFCIENSRSFGKISRTLAKLLPNTGAKIMFFYANIFLYVEKVGHASVIITLTLPDLSLLLPTTLSEGGGGGSVDTSTNS